MPVTRTIRTIRTWEHQVPAEYGDTDADLVAKVSEEQLDGDPPAAEVRVILEAHESPVAKYADLLADEEGGK